MIAPRTLEIGFEVTKNKFVLEAEAPQLRKDLPDFSPGDTVIVQSRVVEGSRERLQSYEGIVISKRNRGLGSSFIVRKDSNGVGVERTFQTHSPLLSKIKVKRKGDVRQANSFIYVADLGVLLELKKNWTN